MLNKILLILDLIRFSRPVGYLLPFYSACFGLLLAGQLNDVLSLIPLYFLGAFAARSAGCIINDIFDRNFDIKVERTKNRVVAAKKLNISTALLYAFFLFLLAFILLLQLNYFAIIFGIIAGILTVIYPLFKRFSYYPQFILGATFNMGLLIAYVSVRNTLDISVMLLYVGLCFWTVGYDSIYAFMDLKDDKKAGVKSFAIILSTKKYRDFLYSFYYLFFLFFLLANISKILNPFLLFLSFSLLIWQLRTLDIENSANCLQRFKINQYIGLLLVLSMII